MDGVLINRVRHVTIHGLILMEMVMLIRFAMYLMEIIGPGLVMEKEASKSNLNSTQLAGVLMQAVILNGLISMETVKLT
jgi:hypothetical protein